MAIFKLSITFVSVYFVLRSLLFLLEPERAHYVTMGLLNRLYKWRLTRWIASRLWGRKKTPSVTVAGITFPNRIGLAAGFDKNARWLGPWSMLAFGHVEVGTVTPRPQPGNPAPRLFRLPEHHALINRMGFNNQGMDVMLHRLERKPKNSNLVIGVNLGKNKDTPNERAVEDYVKGLHALYSVGDYFTVNISSPNTPGLRNLQDEESLKPLLSKLQDERKILAEKHKKHKPLFLKIAPDLSNESIISITHMVINAGFEGMVATNTTITRNGVGQHPIAKETGGLSGAPLKERSLEVVRLIRETAGPSLALIGVGGISSVHDAKAQLAAGADLIQVYTGFIYGGPQFIQALSAI